ncbi:Ribokinase-like protein [Tilletiaria anomala UBC 951]|uniref:ATP-dependent (S)-NAD(P)H-hydrate dehydratase n=1 Tax=Tilletiaria anomala (strain ATCC 24038 / CBS 436.72 / UBC 951) TaxID=1037660 RepID=A0A066VT98_TILAU|nr:Ribokinase-like protein [Tilletiaria anomala UBC 951]KDN44696.1 Ribokinase-like protein [Tilletiaria anomala UBC 951]
MPSAATRHKILDEVRSIVPPLSEKMHKGQAGRVGVVGGSRDYTGAPFFASMSCMRLGADMSHTICEPSAGNVIKTYSPDLIVHRILDENKSHDDIKKEMKGIFERLHSVIVGPGLGRDKHMQSCGKIAMELARESDIYIVVDADGLWLVQNEPDVVKGYTKCILTPNVVEFGRLCKRMGIDSKEANSENAAKQLALALQGPTILEKGRVDRITNGKEVLICDEQGGLKRAGGQGDILSGCLGTFLAWASVYQAGVSAEENVGARIADDRLPLLAGYGGSITTRTCSREGFRRKGRAMLANDLLEEVGPAYAKLFGEPSAAL